MPLYLYRCPSCGTAQDAFNRIDDRDANAPVCCGSATERQITAPMVSVPENCHYVCPVTGQEVTSYRQRRNIMAEHGLRDANDIKPAAVFEKQRKKTEERQRLASQLNDLPPGVTRDEIFAA